VKNNLTARSYNFSPTRNKAALRNEEKVAFFLNNMASIDQLRPPLLADEIIITHEELGHKEEQVPKRLRTRDAGT